MTSTIKEFEAILENHEASEATSIGIPFDVFDVWGSRARIPVTGTINGFPFRSSVVPRGEGKHYMVVNKQVREGANTKAGDTVNVVMQKDLGTRTVTVPDDFSMALTANEIAHAKWKKLSYTHQREYVQAIVEAKREETRKRRIARTVEILSQKLSK